MSNETVIVGGGLAGLAAAAALVKHDVPVTLLESRPRLGGRASSFVDQTTGEIIDNCQHVTMGCCTNFRHFCQMVGIDDLFRTESELFFVGPSDSDDDEPAIDRLASSWLPAPLHLLSSFRKLSYLTKNEKRCLSRGLLKLARYDPSLRRIETIQDWLVRHAQPEPVIDRFWRVVLVSALSERLDRISVAHARKVFVEGFLSNRAGWEVSIPSVPLNVLYGDRITQFIKDNGGQIRLGSGVQKLIEDGNLIESVQLRNGESVNGKQFCLAVPHSALPKLLPESLNQKQEVQRIEKLETAPIASIHLWFDRPIMQLPHAVLVDRFCQWIFDRTNRDGTSDGNYYQVVISAANDVAETPRQDSIERAIAELAEIWPATRDAQLIHSRLIIEHAAVFSVQPGSDDLRPKQQSLIDNLQFAGDWTSTGWPATMEGAVKSGFLAADNILAKLGQQTSLVQPELPASLLSRLLLGV